MFPIVMSNSTSFFEEGSTSSANRVQDIGSLMNLTTENSQQPQETKKRNLSGHSDPEVVVIALSPESIMIESRFFCEICNKGFSRDQNLQLHKRGHNLPWKLKKRNDNELIKKKTYVCPVATCVHHKPSRALGDLTAIKKHYFRKHGAEKKWKCDKCSKSYAVQCDLKAHSKTCVTKEYRSDCGIIFSGRDNLISNMRLCDASAKRSARLTAAATNPNYITTNLPTFHFDHPILPPMPPLYRYQPTSSWVPPARQNPNLNYLMAPSGNLPHLSATALLHVVAGGHISSTTDTSVTTSWQKTDSFTRDFLGLTREKSNDDGSDGGDSGCETELHDINKGRHGVPRDIRPR